MQSPLRYRWVPAALVLLAWLGFTFAASGVSAQQGPSPTVSSAVSPLSVPYEDHTRASTALPSKRYGLSFNGAEAVYSLEPADSRTIGTTDENQIGINRTVGISSGTYGRTFLNSDGTRIRIVAITSPGAVAIRVHFQKFDIPAGDEVYLYGMAADSHVAGPYVDKGPFKDEEFWTNAIEGDTVIIEYFMRTDEQSIFISEISHIYKRPQPNTAPEVLACENDASCFTNLADNAVGRIEYNDGVEKVCTGTIINNLRGDFAPFFLTANHCVSTDTVARTVQVYWFYRTDACNSGRLGNWATSSPAGASLLAQSSSSDSTLLRITGVIPLSVLFAGWDANPQSVNAAVFGLHHPDGYVPPDIPSYLRRSNGQITSLNQSCGATGLSNGYRVDWLSGSTEPGSSGSGLFHTQNGITYLVGVQSCISGPPSCQTDSYYGKFANFYPTIQTFLNEGTGIGRGAPNRQLFIDAANRTNLLQYVTLPPLNDVHRWECSTCDPSNPGSAKGLIQDFNGRDPGVHDALMLADTNTNFVALIYGGMWSKFIALGGLNFNGNFTLGYPIADRNCSDFNGTCFSDAQLASFYGTSYHYQRFQGGALVLHKSGPRIDQNFEVHGAIRTRWQQLGGPDGSLGLPISDEYAWQGKRRSDFEGNSICYDPVTDQTSVGCIFTVQVTVQTNPSGRSLTVDGNSYTTAQTFNWNSGSSHTIGTTTPQSGGTGVRYVWSNWSDGGGISHTVAPTVNTTYTANFTTQYFLTMNGGTGGGVSPSSGFFNSGQGVNITATPNSGFSFSGWTGSGSGSYTGPNNPASVTMNGPITETASFTQNGIQVTVQTSPSGRSITVDSTTYTAPQTFTWTPGSSHTIGTTSPQSGATGIRYVWSNWSDGGGISHTVAPTVNTTYTANFTTQYFLTMNAGTGGGVSPSSGFFNSGQGVNITATPNSGFSFSGWTGSGSGSYTGPNNPASVTMNGPITETASFAFVARTLIVASINPASGVSITVSPTDNNGLGNGVTQFTRVYNNNTGVTLTAPSTAGGNNFSRWQRDGADFSFNQTATVTMDANHTMTAVYGTITRTLTVASTNPGSGVSITVSPNDNNGQGSGVTQFNRTYNNNAMLTLTAPSTASGNNFSRWQRDGVDFAFTLSTNVTMDANRTMTAVYLDSCTPATINLGQTRNGALTTSDCRSPIRGSSYYADRYSFNASAGQQVTILITSSAFDTYLYLIAPNGSIIADNDDGGGGTNSRIPPGTGFFTLPSSGVYIIEATSFDQNETGNYILGLNNARFDFDADGRTDIAVWHPGDGTWYIINSSNGSTRVVQWGASGQPLNIPVAGDYDGDGNADIAVWHPGDGTWYIINSFDGSTRIVQWGASGQPYNIPVPADYDGDGKTDIAVWHPGDGTWYIINSSNGSTRIVQWGASGQPFNIPVPADYDGDGKADIAVWHPGDGTWYIINSSNGSTRIVQWGSSGQPFNIPVPGDYDGDGNADTAVWNPGSGYWYITNSSNGSTTTMQWGSSPQPFSTPVPADYDGDGKTDIAVWHPGDGTWYIINSSNGSLRTVQWGASGLPYNVPIPGR